MIRINLLPTKAAKKKESVIQQLVFGVVAIAIALVYCWFLNRGMERDLANERRRIEELNAKISQLQSVIAKVEDFKRKKGDLNKKIDTIRDLNARRSGPVKLLEEFTYVVPKKAWILAYRESNKQLSLEGMAVDGPTVADFIENLRASKYFFDVQLIQVTQAIEGGAKMQRFSINCRVNYVPPGAA